MSSAPANSAGTTETRRSKSCALASREDARHGAWGICAIVEERRRPAQPEQPPTEYLGCAVCEDAERRRRGRIRRERPDGGAFVDAAAGQTEYVVTGTTVSPVGHERMNHGDDREARAGRGV